jgi:EmrB/QacA subfamily drug resistance transporter
MHDSELPDPLLDAAPPEDVVADPVRRRWILAAMLTALVGVVASVSGLNVAQQDLAADLGASQSELLWIINGYVVALAALLMPIGAIGDRFGRKKVLITGLVVFVVANTAAAFSTEVGQLIASRVVAGVGAAMIMPVTLSVITSSFPGEDRDRAVGLWAGLAGVGGIVGLLVSSFVVDKSSWPWVFVLPIALSLAALPMTVAVVPHSHEHHGGRFDAVGSLLSALAVGGIVLGIHEGPEVGWAAPTTLSGLMIGGLALLAFIPWELRNPHPLIQLRVFRRRPLAAGSMSLLLVFAVMMAVFLVLVQFLQAVLGFSALRASVAMLPMAVVMMPLSSVAPLLTRRVGLRTMLVVGSLLIAGGLALMASLASVDGGYLSVLPGLLVLGGGMGMVMTPSTAAITGSLPAEEQGVASALNDTVRELGGALGIALIGSVLSASYRDAVAGATGGLAPEAAVAVREGIGGAVAVAEQAGSSGAPILAAAREAFVDGWGSAMWVSMGLALLAAAFAAVWTPRHVGASDGPYHEPPGVGDEATVSAGSSR